MSYEALIDRAEAEHKSRGARAAAPLWQRAIIERPDDWRALYGLGSAYAETESDDAAAIALLTRAVESSAGAPEAYTALGSVMRRCQHAEMARWCYEEALNKSPDFPQAVLGMAGSYVNQGNPEKGIPWARKALELPGDAMFRSHVENDLALLLLEAGQWVEGWKYYSRRFNLPHYHVRDFGNIPQWTGEKVGALALHAEQGLGDEIMFASCLNEAMVQTDRVLCEVAPRLITLFQRSFPGVLFFGTPQELNGCGVKPDAWGRLADLLGMYRNVPSDCPGTAYITPDPAKVASYRARLEASGPGPYVGFAWLGGTAKTHEKVRRAPLDYWKRLIDRTPGTKVSLQYGEDGAWHATEKFRLLHWQAAIDDMDEFAALIAALDLSITSPQTATHFAGAMGRECWVPCPEKVSWCFRNGGERMPFYKSVRLFWQENADWRPVFDKMEAAIADFGRIQSAA